MLAMTKFKLDIISDVECTCDLKYVWEIVFLIFLKDTGKEAVNI